jgi:hypothetical protein
MSFIERKARKWLTSLILNRYPRLYEELEAVMNARREKALLELFNH